MSWIRIIRRTCFFYLRKKIKWRITRISSDNILAINTFTEYVIISLLFRMFHILSLLYPMIPWLMFCTRQHIYWKTLCSHWWLVNHLVTYDVPMLILLIFCVFIISMRLYKETFYWSFACFNMYIEKWVIQNNFFTRKAIQCMFYCVFFPVFGYFLYHLTKANGSDTGCEPIHKRCLYK